MPPVMTGTWAGSSASGVSDTKKGDQDSERLVSFVVRKPSNHAERLTERLGA